LGRSQVILAPFLQNYTFLGQIKLYFMEFYTNKVIFGSKKGLPTAAKVNKR